MKNYQKIHAWDLPTDKVYIKLNKDFSGHFFRLAHEKFGSFGQIGKYLHLKRADTTFARNWRKGANCYPLYLMVALANKINVLPSVLESNIEEIKYKSVINGRGGSSGKSIVNPKLPITLNEDFAEIIGHLCGDGTIPRFNQKRGRPFCYINSEPTLIENFKELMKKVFGEIEPNIQIRTGSNYRRPNYYLRYPSIISAFILSVFDFKPGDGKDIPGFVFEMSTEAKARFLKALYDDEGWVIADKKKKIGIGLKPANQIIKIKRLLDEFGIRTGNIRTYNHQHRIEISEQDGILRFSRVIGFVHPEKNRKLDKILKKGWKFRRYNNGQAQQEIVDLLRERGKLEVNQISAILKKHKTTIREHLNNLKKQGLVSSPTFKKKINNVDHYFNSWEIKKENER